MTKTILSFIGGFIVGLLLIWAWNAYSDRSMQNIKAETTAPVNIVAKQKDTPESAVLNEETEAVIQSTRVHITDQPAGTTVQVTSVALEADGWIVVHEEQNGLIGNALGATRKAAGEHTGIGIQLLRETLKGERYWIVLYSDNGDRQFNLRDDFPLRDTQSNPITSSFKAQ